MRGYAMQHELLTLGTCAVLCHILRSCPVLPLPCVVLLSSVPCISLMIFCISCCSDSSSPSSKEPCSCAGGRLPVVQDSSATARRHADAACILLAEHAAASKA